MLVPISWLKDYVDINVSIPTLAKKLVGIGFEVEDIIYQENQATNVVVGKIVKVEKHPNADRLRVTQIDVGTKTIHVVTNVPVEGGETIAVALDGAHLADGHDIKRGELRGVLSEGMLCGLEEVGVTEDDVQNPAILSALQRVRLSVKTHSKLLATTTLSSTSASPQTVPIATAFTKWQKKLRSHSTPIAENRSSTIRSLCPA